MKNIYLFVFWLFCASVAFAQTRPVYFHFNHTVGSEPLKLDTTIFTLWNGKKALLSRAEFYIAEITLGRSGDTPLPLTDLYLLVNANNPTKEYPAGSHEVQGIDSLRLHLGVDEAHNHLDPSTYPPDHPLAHQNPVMHWGWAAGYRFMAIEGLVDNNNDGIPETNFQFHNLGDDLYQNVLLTGMAVAQNGRLDISIKVDYYHLFNTMPMTGSLIQHGSAAPNILMMENAAGKGFLSLAQTSSGTQGLEDLSHQVTIAPNPVKDVATIRSDFNTDISPSMVVINTLGQTVQTHHDLQSSGAFTLDTTGLPQGSYRCVFYQNNRIIAQKQIWVHRN